MKNYGNCIDDEDEDDVGNVIDNVKIEIVIDDNRNCY